MPDVAAYEASVADVERIKKFAIRVARETQHPLEAPISYRASVSVEVPKTVRASGLAGLMGRTVDTTERRQEQRDVVVVGKHWLLERRHHHIERNTKGRDYKNQETTHEQHYFVLMPDGNLHHVYVWEEELVYTNSNGHTSVRVERGHEVWGVDSFSFLRTFDYEKRYSEHGTHGRGTKTWGDREPGRRLLVHAKGIGLSKALKKLLPAATGTPPAPNRSKPATPRSGTGAPSPASPRARQTPSETPGVLGNSLQQLSQWPRRP